MKVLLAKYNMTLNHSNYFDITDPVPNDVLLITKHVRFPRVRKQLTSMQDFSQIQYGDVEIEFGLLNKETSKNNKTIRQFFDEFIQHDNNYPVKKMLVIVDSGMKKSAYFAVMPIEYDLSYANKTDGFKITLKAYDAVVEWKHYAEKQIPAYYFQNATFREYLQNQLMNRFFMNFQNDIPANIGIQPMILNKSLLVWARAGGNENFTIYNIIKGLAVWGLVYKFEVPDAYEAQAMANERVVLTFRLMRRQNGSTAVMRPEDYYRTQLPKIDKSWVLLVNHRYNITDTYLQPTRTYDIVHGVLISETITYNFDNYNFNPVIVGGPPDPCFILDSSVDVYTKKLTVFLGGGIVLQVELDDVMIVEKDMFNLNLTNSAGQEYSLKFANSRVYMHNILSQRSNSRIAPHRLFCNQYIPEPNDFGIYDNCINLNSVLPAQELKVMLKNRGSVKGITGIARSEPDLFDTFIVPYEGINEVHSIIMIDPDYNIDTENGLKAEYQTARIA